MDVILKNVGKRFADQYVLQNINLHFPTGSITGIKGPNGSGKSTLLKMISGHLSCTRGDIIYSKDGRDIPRGEIASSMLFAAPYIDLIDDFSLSEMLHFHKQFRDMEISGSVKDFRKILDYPKITSSQPIKFYSSGMKQRLQLCLMILTKTDVLLLDEPTSYLDEKGVDWFKELLAEFHKGKTVIIASNDDEDFEQCEKVESIAPFCVV